MVKTPSFFKRRRRLIIISVISLITLGVLVRVWAFETNRGNVQNEDNVEHTGQFSDAQLQQANLVLSNGIKIDDPENDFYHFPENHFQPDGRPDNPGPYPLPYTDLRSLTVGADQDYFYTNFQFWGQFPDGPAIYNGDALSSVTVKSESFTFINGENNEDSAQLGDQVVFIENQEGGNTEPSEHPTLSHAAMITPTGQDEQMETVYETNTGAGMVSGGPGYDYVLSAYPLRIFDIKLGDEVTFSFSTETGSNTYHHEALDLLLGQEGSKFGATIQYKLGDNAYDVLSYGQL
jgi:hypothetical protein